MRKKNKELLVKLLLGGALTSSFIAVAYIDSGVQANAAQLPQTTVSITGDTIQIGEQAAQSVTVDVDGTQETIAFDIQDGAFVRLQETTGIRFASFVSKTDYEELTAKYTDVQFGTIFKIQDTAEPFEFGDAGVGNIGANRFAVYDESVLRYCSTIDNIPEINYDTTIYARSYVAITHNNTTYYGYTDLSLENGRNVDFVATKALLNQNSTLTAEERYLLENFAADKKEGVITVDCSSDNWMSAFGEDAVQVMETSQQTATKITKSVLDVLDDETAATKQARSKEYTVYTENDVYKVDAVLATKVITTAEELANLQSYTTVTEISSGATNTSWVEYGKCSYSYGGYFVLANDITATGTESAFKAPALGNYSSGGTVTAEMGFHGTFDGQGHTVSGFNYDVGGVFGEIGDNAVIQNVAFTNCTVGVNTRQNAVGVLSSNATGTFTVSNVYVQGNIWGSNCGMLLGKSIKGGTLQDVVINMTINNGSSATNDDCYTVGAVASADRGFVETYENVTVVYGGEAADVKECKVLGNGGANTYSGITEYQTQADGIVKKITSKTQTSNTVISAVTIGDTATKEDFSAYSDNSWTVFATYAPMFNEYLADGTRVYNITMKTLDLEVKSEKTLATQLVSGMQGLVSGATVNAVYVEGDMTTDIINDGTFLSNVDTAATTEADRTKTFIVHGEDCAYKVKTLVITKIITSASELANLISYANNKTAVAGRGNYTAVETWSYNGYFTLANNLTYNEADTNNNVTFNNAPSIGTANDKKVASISSIDQVNSNGTAGFHGTFDGRGYTIDGFTYDIGGIFGVLGDNAVIKNVAFTNCTVGDKETTDRQEAVIAQIACGSTDNEWKIENVYMQGVMNGATSGMMLGYRAIHGELSNVVTQTQSNYTSDRLGAIAFENYANLVYNNVTSVYLSGSSGRGNKEYKPFGVVHATNTFTIAEYELQSDGTVKKIASIDFNGTNYPASVTLGDTATLTDFANYDTTYWTVVEGCAPVFKAKN